MNRCSCPLTLTRCQRSSELTPKLTHGNLHFVSPDYPDYLTRLPQITSANQNTATALVAAVFRIVPTLLRGNDGLYAGNSRVTSCSLTCTIYRCTVLYVEHGIPIANKGFLWRILCNMSQSSKSEKT